MKFPCSFLLLIGSSTTAGFQLSNIGPFERFTRHITWSTPSSDFENIKNEGSSERNEIVDRYLRISTQKREESVSPEVLDRPEEAMINSKENAPPERRNDAHRPIQNQDTGCSKSFQATVTYESLDEWFNVLSGMEEERATPFVSPSRLTRRSTNFWMF
jgi:hypothetical protein